MTFFLLIFTINPNVKSIRNPRVEYDDKSNLIKQQDATTERFKERDMNLIELLMMMINVILNFNWSREMRDVVTKRIIR